MAGQLHALLAAAGISGPLVLMGHSAGGLHIRAYTARFPQDVGGLVFVDATTPGLDRRIPAAVRALGEHGPFQRALFKTMIALGIPRALGECTTPPPGFGATANLWRADACRPSYVTTWARESAALRPSPVEPARNNPFGELPVLVFSRDPHSPPPHQLPAYVSAGLATEPAHP
ncbi:alpha/beta fold hydrolase [Frateuria flava]